MYIKGKVTNCDFSSREYNRAVDGIHCLARGATGRWCCVMWMGPEYAKEVNAQVITYDEAVARIQAGNKNDTIDF